MADRAGNMMFLVLAIVAMAAMIAAVCPGCTGLHASDARPVVEAPIEAAVDAEVDVLSRETQQKQTAEAGGNIAQTTNETGWLRSWSRVQGLVQVVLIVAVAVVLLRTMRRYGYHRHNWIEREAHRHECQTAGLARRSFSRPACGARSTDWRAPGTPGE